MTYSLDFRLRVLSVKKEKDLSFSETAERFGVGMTSIVRWIKKPEPQTHRHKPATKLRSGFHEFTPSPSESRPLSEESSQRLPQNL